MAKGNNCRLMASGASSANSLSPLLAIMTGSMTRLATEWRRRVAATASMMAASTSIPVLTASVPMSDRTASNCVVTCSGYRCPTIGGQTVSHMPIQDTVKSSFG